MIQAKDLRIGNLVGNGKEFEDDDQMFKVLQIGSEEQQFEQIYAEGEESFEWLFKDNYCGVPLTEELLIRFGFKPATRSPYIDKRAWSIGEDASRIYWCEGYLFKATSQTGFIQLTPFMRKVEYAHLLQNAVEVLTGEELILKN